MFIISFCLKTGSFVFSTLQNYELFPPIPNFSLSFPSTYCDNYRKLRHLIPAPPEICRIKRNRRGGFHKILRITTIWRIFSYIRSNRLFTAFSATLSIMPSTMPVRVRQSRSSQNKITIAGRFVLATMAWCRRPTRWHYHCTSCRQRGFGV